MFEYKCFQLPSVLFFDAAFRKQHGNQSIAKYIEQIIQRESVNGFEFYSTNQITELQQPGCMASLFGQKETVITYSVLVFRRNK